MENYEETYEQLSSGQKGQLQNHGQDLIQYIQETDTPYATSQRIIDEAGIDADPQSIGNAMSAIEELYDENFDYTAGESTRGQWIIFKLKKQPLDELADQILEQ